MNTYKQRSVKITDLKPYKKNARQHPQSQIDQLMNSINEFGFTTPLLIDDKNEVIAGHGRLAAAIALDMVRVPCVILTGLTQKQKRALVIADNKIALNSTWDFETLTSEMMALEKADFGMDLVGFSDKELKNLLGGDDDAKGKKQNTNFTGDRFVLMVQFETESECEELYGELSGRGIECKIIQ